MDGDRLNVWAGWYKKAEERRITKQKKETSCYDIYGNIIIYPKNIKYTIKE